VKFVVRNFQQATRYVHGKSGDFVCGLCDKRFFIDCDKVLHERMHTGEKSYQCDDCRRAFHRKETLKRHKNSLLKELSIFVTCASMKQKRRDKYVGTSILQLLV
jgi:uncharacterized Zn-finger protein